MISPQTCSGTRGWASWIDEAQVSEFWAGFLWGVWVCWMIWLLEREDRQRRARK